MSIRKMEAPIKEVLPINYVLVSVFDKTGLDKVVATLMEVNPDVKFVSTGGTGKKIQELLGEDYKRNYVSVEELSSTPEMEGGLVKTLTPDVHARDLGERANPAHQDYLNTLKYLQSLEPILEFMEQEGVTVDQVREYIQGMVENTPDIGFFDLSIVSLYPAKEKAEQYHRGEISFEEFRGFIDIGGPTMLRAAAKNSPNCAIICHHNQYGEVLEEIREKGGVSFETRKKLAQDVFALTSEYDSHILSVFREEDMGKIKECYNFEGGE